MSSSVAALRSRRKAASLGPAQLRERSIRRRVGVVWGLLILNSMTYYGSVLPVPGVVGKLIQQGALLASFLPWLMLNRDGLTILVHPETGDDLADHTDHAAWLGGILRLRLGVFRSA